MRGQDAAVPPRREDSFVRQVLERLRQRVQLRPEQRLPIARAAAVLQTTPRMLRYRESLGLVTPARSPGGHREYGERELLAAAYADELERRYHVSPSDLAFAVRVLAEVEVAADVRRLGQLTRRIPPSPPVAALDFEAQKARRLLRMPGLVRAHPSDTGAGAGPSEPHSLNVR